MKGKRHSTEEKIRILRKIDQGRTIIDRLPGAQHQRTILPPVEVGVWDAGSQSSPALEGLGERTERSEIARPQVCPKGEAKPKQNARLKRMVADQALGMELLQEALEKKL